LKAPKPKRWLSFHADLVHAQALGQRGQRMKRRRRMARALLQVLAELRNAVGIDDELLLAAEFQDFRRARIADQPGRNHGRS
jgi:hypothetical protein